MLERQLATLAPIASHVLLVTQPGGAAPPPGVTHVVDLVPGAGPLGGIYTALMASTTDLTLVVAGDMPLVSGPLLAHLVARAGSVDVVIPRTRDGHQPLCAVYAKSALEPVRRRLEAGSLKVLDLVAGLRVREIGPEELEPLDPTGTAFLNINTPEEYERALELARQP